MHSLDVTWTKHLRKEEDKKNLELALRNSVVVLGRLYEILEEKERELTSKELSHEAYSNASWAYAQADINGARRVLRDLKKLLRFLDPKGP